MNIYSKKIRWKFLLLLLAILIGLGSLYYTRSLVDSLSEEEKKKAEIWAQATAWITGNLNEDDEIIEFLIKTLDNPQIRNPFFKLLGENDLTYMSEMENDSLFEENIKRFKWKLRNRHSRNEILDKIVERRYVIDGFMLQIIQGNETIPVIVTNEKKDSIIYNRNFKNPDRLNDTLYVNQLISALTEQGKVMTINFLNSKQYLYYDNSVLLRKLAYFPYFQLGIILLFILVAYFAFSASRNAEQNQVWVGLSKETAHQLGTPTSSMMAWVELLKSKNVEENAIKELDKDVQRLKKITDRFSKIGSKPRLKENNIVEVLHNAVEYIRTRSSNRVKITIQTEETDLLIPLNVDLFEWVIENLCKNAIDAMEGNGELHLEITDNTQVVYVDVTDTGKGIAKTKYKTIFKPGFTTKERGWGLGLSLSKRIIENYHDGKIFVHSSDIGKGSRFRIVLKKFF